MNILFLKIFVADKLNNVKKENFPNGPILSWNRAKIGPLELGK